jgi:hypothetical protein
MSIDTAVSSRQRSSPSSPGHLLGDHFLASRARHSADLGFDDDLRPERIEVPPAPNRPVIDRPRREATHAKQTPSRWSDQQHHSVGLEGDVGHFGAKGGDDLVECSRGAHSSPTSQDRLA